MKPGMLNCNTQGDDQQTTSFKKQTGSVSAKTKIVPLLVLLMAISSFGFAQGFHVGIKGGVNMFKIDGQSFNDEFRYGYNAGLFSEINFGKKWGIQPEVLWNQSQTRTTTHFQNMYNQGFSGFKDVTLNYLSIPLLLSYRPAKLISFQAGPQFGVLINHNQDLLSNGKTAFRSGDFSMLGGIQLNIGGAKIGGRYVVGLSNINDIDNREKWKNQGFQLYLGFRII
jgi:hypothetical protein